MAGWRLGLAAGALLLLPGLACQHAAPGRDAGAQPPAADFFVATDGNDAWSGTLAAPNADASDGPFATLARARDAVRGLIRRGRGNATVLVRGGTYRLSETVVFSLPDSAPEDGTIAYAAYPGERPVFSSGRPIANWRRLGEPPGELPEAARGKVWVADVAAFGRFYTLFDGDRELPRARTKGFRQTNSTPRGTKSDNRTVQFPKGTVGPYTSLADAELRIIPCCFWVMNLLPVESIDPATRTLRTTVPGTYPLGRNGMTDRPTAWVENVLEALDEPGEWVLDTTKGLLYLWPEGDRPSGGIVAPALTELIRIEGTIDYEGPTDTPVRGIVLRGLTFMHGDRLPWHGRTGWGLQHDWELFDKPTALVRLRGAERCAVEDCTLTASGHTAVRLDLHAQHNRIVGNHIHHVGGVGVLLAGYGPGTKDANKHNEVVNNLIHHIGRQYWGSAAIFAWQSGENRIAHNHVHHIPYTAILATGRIHRAPPGPAECSRTIRRHEVPKDFAGLPWAKREPYLHARRNLIAYNDLHHCMETLGDGNCVYVSGAGGGNIVRGNYCHDCVGAYMNAVIRCDDDQHQTLIERNVCARTGGHGEGIISKGDNDIVNNVVADLRPVHRHRGYIVFPYGNLQGATVEHNILYSRRKGQTLYHEGGSRRGGGPPRLRDTTTDRNLYWCSADEKWAARHLARCRPQGIDAHSRIADPLFKDIDRGDFGFRDGSPAPGLGIEPLDTSQAGLEEPYRTRLLGRIITTRIEPGGGVLDKPVHVTITCSAPDAAIHYTLDGSEPTEASRRYSEPFVLERPATVRARAFAPQGSDFAGAVAQFLPPPQPIVEDFEDVPVGNTTPNATTSEDAKKKQYTARVSDEQAAGGKRSLKFTDGPGQQHPFSPHVYYRCRFVEGRMVGRLAVRLDANAQFRYQWRHYEGSGYREGPTIFITPGGKLQHGGKTLLTLPVGQWVRFEVRCDLGEKPKPTFALRVWLPGASEPKLFAALPHDAGFERLDWVGLIANGQRACVFYVDDVEVRPAE